MKRTVFSSVSTLACCLIGSMLMVGCEDDGGGGFHGAALAPVASGQGVPEAAAYDRSQPGPHKAVILSSSGGSHEWNGDLPDAWSASSVKNTQLVVLVGPEREVSIQSCDYNIGPNINRYRFEVDVTLRCAKLARTVATTTLRGSDPSSCPFFAPVDQTRTEGSHVDFAALQTWLQPYVE